MSDDDLFGDLAITDPPADRPADSPLDAAQPQSSLKPRKLRKRPLGDQRPADETNSKQAVEKTLAQLTRHEKYEVVEVHRSEIKNAPYNPRQMTPKARKKLRDNMARVGLLDPIIWNRQTGNIVGGHQRIAVLDALEGTRNYRLRVAAVDLDPKTEKEQNVFLNNESAQGVFDMEALEKLFAEDKIDPTAAGYDLGELFQAFGKEPDGAIDAMSADALSEVAERLRNSMAAMTDLNDALANQVGEDDHFFAVVVFRDSDERQQFTATLELPDNRYIDGRELWSILESCGAIAGDETAADVDTKIKLPIPCCDRCGMDHVGVLAYRLASPIPSLPDATYWASCPTNGEPIFLSPDPDQLADLHEAALGLKKKKSSTAARTTLHHETAAQNAAQPTSESNSSPLLAADSGEEKFFGF